MSRSVHSLHIPRSLDFLKDDRPLNWNALRSLPLRRIVVVVLASWLVLVILRTLIKAYITPLRDVPGPWIAKFTRLWLLRAINTRSWEKINVALHQKYGPVVRISPNEYSIDDPEAAKVIYRARDELVKAERYSAWGLPNQEPNIFTERSLKRHAERRKQVNALYLNHALYNMEMPVDRSTTALCDKLSEFAEKDEVIEIFDWLHYFAFDTIGGLAFGKPFGFLHKGADIREIMSSIHNYSRYGAVVGVFAEWHATIFRLLTALAPGGEVGMAYIIKFTAQSVTELGQNKYEYKEGENDILSSLFAKHQKEPNTFKIEDIYYHTLSNVVAGAETTGITLSAAVYFLWRHPSVLAKLRHELEAHKAAGQIGDPITVKQAAECPYLQAVIKETLRLHPGNGLGLPRVVPKGGLTLAGHDFPAGTEVGINAYVAHANRAVYGPDADSFSPERWLDNDPAALTAMDNYFFTFGRGPRTCLGKNVSLMELSKLLPELVLRFDIAFQHPGREWVVRNDWFVRQEGVPVKIRKRGGAGGGVSTAAIGVES